MNWVIVAALNRRYEFLEAIERLQAGPGDFVDHKLVAEALNLDLQTVEDELDAMEKVRFIELKPTLGVLYVALSAAGRRLLRWQAERRMQLPKAREAQRWILQLLMDQPSRADARWTTDADLARELDLDNQFLRDNLEELRAQNLVTLRRPVDLGGVTIVDLTGAGRLKAREPDYVSHRPSTQITNISTEGGHYYDIGGDFAGENLDKRQGEVFVGGSVISGNVVGASPDVLGELASQRPTPEGALAQARQATEQASRRGDDDEGEDYTAVRIG